jgi:hypothetical protein
MLVARTQGKKEPLYAVGGNVNQCNCCWHITGAVCDQKTSKFFVLHGRTHGRLQVYKWSFLKNREEKCKVEYGGTQVESGDQGECAFLFQVLLKPMVTHTRGRTW